VNNELVVAVGPLKASFAGLGEDGNAGALDDDGNVRLQPGSKVRIKLNGFAPKSVVEAWLFSTPVLMGKATVAADGTVVGDFSVPKDVPTGAHRISIVAKTTDGKPATLTVGVMVGEWDKGPAISVWLIVLPLAFAVIGALILPASRRRRRVSDVA
jgi:hypothetical protein